MVSGRNGNLSGTGLGSIWSNILATNLASLRPCIENLCQVALKDNGLICLMEEEVSRQESIQVGAEKAALTVESVQYH